MWRRLQLCGRRLAGGTPGRSGRECEATVRCSGTGEEEAEEALEVLDSTRLYKAKQRLLRRLSHESRAVTSKTREMRRGEGGEAWRGKARPGRGR